MSKNDRIFIHQVAKGEFKDNLVAAKELTGISSTAAFIRFAVKFILDNFNKNRK